MLSSVTAVIGRKEAPTNYAIFSKKKRYLQIMLTCYMLPTVQELYLVHLLQFHLLLFRLLYLFSAIIFCRFYLYCLWMVRNVLVCQGVGSRTYRTKEKRVKTGVDKPGRYRFVNIVCNLLSNVSPVYQLLVQQKRYPLHGLILYQGR